MSELMSKQCKEKITMEGMKRKQYGVKAPRNRKFERYIKFFAREILVLAGKPKKGILTELNSHGNININ